MLFWGEVFVVIFAISLAKTAASQPVSFYGESYIRIPFQEASSTSHLQLQFKSHRSHGLLFLASGKTDYITVELKSGIVHVHLDLGSGPATLYSQPSIRLDDVQWHSLKLERSKSTVILTIDGIYTTTVQTKGEFFELNIEHGLFLGGRGNFEDAFSGRLRNFRGCLREVVFNKNDLIQQARQITDSLNIFEVTWDCNPQFESNSDQPVSFLTRTSFVAFPYLHIRNSGIFSCDFKTRNDMAMVLFNAGHLPNLDFIALEIVHGRLKLSVDKGNGVAELESNKVVNDGNWHQLDFTIATSSVELTVDGERKSMRFNLGDSTQINLAGHLFLGGISFNARSHALRKGLVTLQENGGRGVSLKGCMKNIVLNSRSYGFREIQISRSVQASCVWDYPCASDPCIPQANCQEVGHSKFVCKCEWPVCVRDTSRSESKLLGEALPLNDVLFIQSVKIDEGTEIEITTNNIELLFDYSEHRIRESAVTFDVTLPPKHGTLEVINGIMRNQGRFTLLDIISGKVHYLHDGTDTVADDATLAMSVQGYVDENGIRLKDTYSFTLPIIINPQNDPPKIVLPQDNTIQMIENSRIQISKDILWSADPDTGSDNLVYSAIYQSERNGFFERGSDSGNRVNTFTQKEIEEGYIWFVHVGEVDKLYVRLKVNDGTSDSPHADLRVLAVSLQLRLTSNTGLTVAWGHRHLISRQNLSMTTNVPKQNIRLNYQLNEQPRYGELQKRQRGTDTWVMVNTFSQDSINRGKIRYINTNSASKPILDQFKFIVQAENGVKSRENVFRINLRPVTINVHPRSKLILNAVSEKTLSSDDFKIIVNVPDLSPRKVILTINQYPVHGHLSKSGVNLLDEATFTLLDLNLGNIVYKLNKMTYDPFEDEIGIKISTDNAEDVIFPLKVQYIPEETNIRFINNGLSSVIEGGQKNIEKNDLYVEMNEVKDFRFTVTEFAKHGVLILMDARTSGVMEKNISTFSKSDIHNRKLVYKHDDSEHNKDSFSFIVTPVINNPETFEGEITELSGTFDVTVTMRNDNPPKRLVEKVFHVVTNKDKLLTIDDLAFIDPDTDYDSNELTYIRRGIPDGEFVDSINGTKIYRFKQKDLVDERILFKHNGPARTYRRAVIQVTDGQYITTSLFEYQASNPFVNIQNNTGISVEKGKHAVVTASNLSIDTNVNINSEHVRILLIEEPEYGNIYLGSVAVSDFTLADVISGRVSYHHDGSNHLEDKFQFAVNVLEAQVQGQFAIKIYLRSQQHPPRIVHNKVLEVEEGGSSILHQHLLLITHPDSLPLDIMYTVVLPPQFGTIKIIGQPQVKMPPMFTQQDIIDKKVQYRQSKTLQGRSTDKFVFDVSNGFHTLQRIEFYIRIIPKLIRIETLNLSVTEGEKVVLSKDNVRIMSRHFSKDKFIFKITKTPKHGWLQIQPDSEHPITEFSSDQLSKNAVFYQHDDSETLDDEFSFIGKLDSGAKDTETKTIYVKIKSINDQPPRVVVNKGLMIWKGAMQLITSECLRAEDPDSVANKIMYQVSSPTNGHIAIVNNTFWAISSFTQALIDNNQITFVHKGGDTGYFNFQVTDGRNVDVLRKFTIVATPLLLTIEENQPLEVYPNTIQPITVQHLLSSTNDPNQTKPIMYTVKRKPGHGRIVTLVHGRPFEVTTFTQQEISDGAIHYQHTGYVQGWSQKDRVYFDVSVLYAEPVPDEMFDISVSYGNLNEENKHQLLVMKPLKVREGADGVISRNLLDSSGYRRQLLDIGKSVDVEYMIAAFPQHGKILLNGSDVKIGSKFRQDVIDRLLLKYSHDGSDTLEDAFKLILLVSAKDSSSVGDDVMHAKLTSFFNISVDPVNDEPFVVVTKNPSIQVVQGFSINITKDDLYTKDKDTLPEGITYVIISGPNNGMLVFSRRPKYPIRQFTQKDVNDNRVMFVHDGSRGPGAFHFRVSDGAFKPFYKPFNIRVIPIVIKLSSYKDIHLVQSHSSKVINSENLDIETNGLRSQVNYTVTTLPKFGKLYIGEDEVIKFSQLDIDNEVLAYYQTDMTVGADSFKYKVSVGDTTLYDQYLNITVIPYVKQLPLDAPSGSHVAINILVLDASELAGVSGDNPRYDIVKEPQFGMVLKKIGSRRDLVHSETFREVKLFTHEDILYGRVYYVSEQGVDVATNPSDSFTYILSAYNVQPATGVFVVSLKPPDSEDGMDPTIIPLTKSPVYNGSPLTGQPPLFDDGDNDDDDDDSSTDNVSPGFENGATKLPEHGLVSPSISTDNLILIIVFICLIVIIAIIVSISIIVCRKRRAKKKQEEELWEQRQRSKLRPVISGPLQLENQPHVHIEAQKKHLSVPISVDEQTLMLSSPESEDEREHTYSNVQNQNSKVYPTTRSPDLSRTEFSTTVPTCKVTPLIEAGSAGRDSTYLNQNDIPKSPTGSGFSADSVEKPDYDWTLLDTELLHSTGLTNPVLKKNQYWV